MSDAGWPAAVAGCEYVLHIASPFPATVPKHENELIVPAREGDAAGAAGVARCGRETRGADVVVCGDWVWTSDANGQFARAGALQRQKDWTNPDGADVMPYTKSKTLAERAAWDFIARDAAGLEMSVVNPVAVFGPVLGPDYATSILLVQRMMDGTMPGVPRICFGVVDVRDVADLAFACDDGSGGEGRAVPCGGRRLYVDCGDCEDAEGAAGRGGEDECRRGSCPIGWCGWRRCVSRR